MRILFTVLLVCVSSSAFGTVYSWTDSRGVAHYTNKEYEIPDRYRATTKALYPEQADSGQAPQAGQARQIPPQGTPTPPPTQARPETPQRPVQTQITPKPKKGEMSSMRYRKSRHKALGSDDE